jgi:hypothetical protein
LVVLFGTAPIVRRGRDIFCKGRRRNFRFVFVGGGGVSGLPPRRTGFGAPGIFVKFVNDNLRLSSSIIANMNTRVLRHTGFVTSNRMKIITICNHVIFVFFCVHVGNYWGRKGVMIVIVEIGAEMP